MYHSWLDRWDERRAQRGEEAKEATAFVLDSCLAFPNDKRAETIEEFCALADRAASDPSFYGELVASGGHFTVRNGLLKFPSDIDTDVEENNVVWAKVTEGNSLHQALVIFHHWNASRRNRQLSQLFSRLGITTVEIAMPYHLERSRPGSVYAEDMLSSNLGRTIQSVRQAVLDGRKLIRWLKSQGYREISVLGMSLGSWVAGLIAAHEPIVTKASLFLSADSLADMVWTGRATRSVRAGLEDAIGLGDLRRAWGPLNLENYAAKLARPDLALHLLLAKRDNVVLPKLSDQFLGELRAVGASARVLRLNCGHYSLAIPPYAFLAAFSLMRFLSSEG